MKPGTLLVIGLLTIGVLAVVLMVALWGCTLVYVRGSSNHLEDTGGHGGGLTVRREVDPDRPRLIPQNPP